MAGCHLKPIHKNEFNAPAKFAFNRHRAAAPMLSTSACNFQTFRQVDRSKVIPGTSGLLET